MNQEALVSSFRKDFPFLSSSNSPGVYLDTAATAQKPQSVIDAMTQFYTNEYGTVHRAIYHRCRLATAKYQHVREQLKTFLNSSKSEEIIFTRGTTESINLVASSFGKAYVQKGDEILVSAMEHHSNLVPWQLMCQERGAHLRIIPMDHKGELILEEYERLLTPRTRLVAVAHISNSIGTRNPIKQMATLAHQAGAKILVDGAQSAPHMKIDVQDLDIDFFVFSGHKLYGPTGIGVLYGKEELLLEMPPYQGGGDMVERVEWLQATYQLPPLKFEAGTPMIAEVIGLGAAVTYLEEIGFEIIEQREQLLMAHAQEVLKTIPGLRWIGDAKDRGSLLSFLIQGVHPLDLATLLDVKGFAIRSGHHCAQPVMQHFQISGTVRISFGLYNQLEEIDAFCSALRDTISLFRR